MMEKSLATYLFGTEDQAAKWLGVSVDVYRDWPERMRSPLCDRVYAAILRRETAKALGQTHKQFFADFRGELVIKEMLQKVSIAAIMSSMLPRVPPEFMRLPEPPPDEKANSKRKRPGRALRLESDPPQAVAG